MYKDVWKRIWAMVLAMCMVVTLVQGPETVMAAETKSYHTYQHGGGSTSGWVEANSAAAVFTVGQNSSGGAEILDSISFYAHVNDEGLDTKATVSYYINPQGDPDSGTRVHAKVISDLTEGQNTVEAGMDNQELAAGTTFAVVVSLEGANLAYYGGASAGQTYVSVDGSWADASASGQCVAISAYTYDVGDDGEDGNPGLLDQFVSIFSLDDVTPQTTSNAHFNKTNIVVAKGGYGEVTLTDADGSISWSIENQTADNVAEISDVGNNTAKIWGVNPGDADIVAVCGGVTYTCKLKVTASVEDAEITLKPAEAVYDGERHVPLVNVKIGDTDLKASTDYQVTCTDAAGNEVNLQSLDALINAGTYTFAIIAQQGNYTGTKTVEYTVSPKQITDETVQVTLGTWKVDDPTAYVTGVTDTVIKDNGNNGELTKDETAGDYYVVAATNDERAEGVNVVGVGNYAGTLFCAAPKSIENAVVTFDKSEYIYTGRAWKPQVAVAVDGIYLSQSDYTVEYSENTTDVGTAGVTIKGQNGYYGTLQKTFEIKAKDISNADQALVNTPVQVDVSDAVEGVAPQVSIIYNDMELVDGTDYDFTYSSNGTQGTCVIIGKGNYTGTSTQTYTVASNDIENYIDTIAFADDGTTTLTLSYTGAALKPMVYLFKNGVATDLELGTDYIVTYSKNINAGNATVYVKGIGNYGGSVDTTFEIGKANMSSLRYYFKDESGNEVSVSSHAVQYSPNEEDLKPEVVVKNGQNVLKEGTDYTLTYSLTDVTGNMEAGLTVTVNAVEGGNYTGEAELLYSVEQCKLDEAIASGKIILTIDKQSFSYNGESQTPKVTLAYAVGDTTLMEGTDYKITYSLAGQTVMNPTSVGVYTLRIVGLGNYANYVERTFKITNIDITTISKVEPEEGQTGLVTDYKGAWFAMKWYDSADEENNKLKLTIVDNNGNVLDEGTDYKLEYDEEGLSQVSTSSIHAKVTIVGMGDYSGEREIYYLLAGALDEFDLSVDNENLVYTGAEVTLAEDNVTVYSGSFLWKTTLKQGVDYTLIYENNVNAGTKAGFVVEPVDDTMLPTENGCYRYAADIDADDKLHNTFAISQKNIGDNDVVLVTPIEMEYKGRAVELNLTDIALEYNGMTLANGDFAIDEDTYLNNTKAGENASVRVNGQGNYTGDKQIPFVICGKSLDNLQAVVEELTYTGAELYPQITSLMTADGKSLVKGTDYQYETGDYKDNINAGPGTITIHGLGEYLGSEAEISFEILQRDISAAGGTATIQFGQSGSYTYTSWAIEPSVEVNYQLDGAAVATTLTADKDYTVGYDKNTDCTNAAKVIITGTGNYTGTVEGDFTIAPKSISETEADIEVAEIPSQKYDNGKAVTPSPNISYRFGSGDADVYRLTGDDYTLTYTGEKSVGQAAIKIKGKGNFTGERTIYYHIGSSINDEEKVIISCPDAGGSFVYKGSEYTPEVTLTNVKTGDELDKGIDYTVTYQDNINVGTAIIKVEGLGAYAEVKEFTFEITSKNLADSDVAVEIEGVADGSHQETYTGSPIEPTVTLVYNGNTVTEGYTVDYGTDNTSTGFVNVTVTALADSNFTGTKTVQDTTAAKFEIVAASIGAGGNVPAAGFTMEVVEPQPLSDNGRAEPQPKLYYNGVALAAGIDYEYSYENNTDTGTDAIVILTGTGNYTGSLRQKFEICGSIEGAVVTIDAPNGIWYKDYVTTAADGTVKIEFDNKITVTVDDKELVRGTDYDISYVNNTWVGTATVIIKGKGAYAGIVTKEVMIMADLSETTITIGDQMYTGSPIEVTPIIEYYGTALTEGTHFVIHTYSDDHTSIQDNASVTVIGNEENGFFGSQTGEFKITTNVGALTVSGVAKNYLYRGERIKPEVVVTVGNTTLTEDVDYKVTYGTNTNVGNGTIQIVGIGDYAGLNAKSVLFNIVAQDISTLDVLDGAAKTIADRDYTGMAILPELTLVATIGTKTYTMLDSDYTMAPKAGNTSVGAVTLVLTGTGNVTGTREVTFNIVPKSLSIPTDGSMDRIQVRVTQNTYAYDGTAKEPAVIVEYQYGDTDTDKRTLVKDTDYTVSYSNNVAAGTASVTVTGIGNYTGFRTENFTITAQNISAAVVTFPNGTTYPYMGSTVGIEPDVVVTVNGVTLTENTDYTLSYNNNTACGNATVKVTGKGDFSGSTTASFTIAEHSINASDVVIESIPNQAYTGSPIVPDVKITCGTYELVKGVDFELTGSNNTQIGQASVTIKGIGGFKDSRLETFMIAYGVDQAEISGLKDSYPYTGAPYTQSDLGITDVSIGDTVLSASDYTIELAEDSDGISVGTQEFVLIGTGNYGGTKTFEITITPKNIADADVVMTGFEDTLPYADPLMQDITLTWNGITLQKGTDYEVSCDPSATAGIYTMRVTGSGNFSGSFDKKFTVDQTPIAGAEVKLEFTETTYTGTAIEPKVTVTVDGVELKEGTDYTLTYDNNVNAGVAKVYVTGAGVNYIGKVESSFVIRRKPISHCTIGSIADQVYTGEDIRPEVTVKYGQQTLVKGTDYALMYKNERDAGTASVVVTGKGNYTSTKTIAFGIRPCVAKAITVTGASGTTISLSWKGEGAVTGYEIYRAGANGTYQLVGQTRNSSFTDTKLSGNTSYTYKIRSYVVQEGDTCYGEFSSTINASTSK